MTTLPKLTCSGTTIFIKIPAALFAETDRSMLDIQETHNCQKILKKLEEPHLPVSKISAELQ